MPAAVLPAIASAGLGYLSGTTILGLSVLASAGLNFAGSLILGGLSSALTPKPKTTGYAQATSSSTIALRQPDLTRQHVYGHTRITRGYAHMQSTGANGTLHMILMLCEGGGGLRAINEIWVNDYCIPPDWIDADGNVTEGRYKNYMTIRKHLGEDDQAADPNAVANMDGWTVNHRLQGIAYLYITMTKNQDVYPTGVPNFSAIVEGPRIYDPRLDAMSWSTNIPLYACDFLRNTEYGFAVYDTDISLSDIAAEANISDEIVTTLAEDSNVITVVPGTDLITLDGDILKYQYGDRVQLVTAGTPPGGLATNTNYYVIPYQVLTTPRIKLAASLDDAMANDAIDITSTGSGAFVIRKTGEPRYHGSGIFDTQANLSDTLNNIVTCAAGRAINVGGFWNILVGAYRAPDVNYNIDDCRGSGLSFKNDLSLSESYNLVKGKYITSLNQYQASDYPSAFYQQFVDDDNGLEQPKEINLEFTNRATTAQRIAKIELFRGRQGIVATSNMSTKALQNKPGDVIGLDMDHLGWEGKPFEITEFSLDFNADQLLTKLTFRETAQAIYDWSSGEAIFFDPAPNTNLPNPYVVLVPSGVKYNSRQITTAAGDILFILQLQWNLHPDAFVREFGNMELSYKLSSETEWLPSYDVSGRLIQTDVLNASGGTKYDLRIRARNNIGVRSPWVTLTEVVVGSSGGVTDEFDYGLITDSADTFIDYGFITDPADTFDDFGYVV